MTIVPQNTTEIPYPFNVGNTGQTILISVIGRAICYRKIYCVICFNCNDRRLQ